MYVTNYFAINLHVQHFFCPKGRVSLNMTEMKMNDKLPHMQFPHFHYFIAIICQGVLSVIFVFASFHMSHTYKIKQNMNYSFSIHKTLGFNFRT